MSTLIAASAAAHVPDASAAPWAQYGPTLVSHPTVDHQGPPHPQDLETAAVRVADPGSEFTRNDLGHKWLNARRGASVRGARGGWRHTALGAVQAGVHASVRAGRRAEGGGWGAGAGT